jgi:cell division septation protein DedD
MPIETKKVLWTALSVLIVLVVAFGIALAFVMPKGDTAMAPASIGATTPPRVAAPEAYIRSAEPAPVPLAPGSTVPSGDSGVIIIYGEKPATPALPVPVEPLAQTGSAGTATASTSAAPASQAKPYTPAPPASAAPKAPAQTSTAVTTAAKPAAAAKPSASTTVTEFWIQAASFTSRTRAEDLQRSLVDRGLSSIITVKEIDGTPYFRVRIGPYNAKTEADGWLTRIRQMAGCEEAYVSMQTVQRSS